MNDLPATPCAFVPDAETGAVASGSVRRALRRLLAGRTLRAGAVCGLIAFGGVGCSTTSLDYSRVERQTADAIAAYESQLDSSAVVRGQAPAGYAGSAPPPGANSVGYGDANGYGGPLPTDTFGPYGKPKRASLFSRLLGHDRGPEGNPYGGGGVLRRRSVVPVAPQYQGQGYSGQGYRSGPPAGVASTQPQSEGTARTAAPQQPAATSDEPATISFDLGGEAAPLASKRTPSNRGAATTQNEVRQVAATQSGPRLKNYAALFAGDPSRPQPARPAGPKGNVAQPAAAVAAGGGNRLSSDFGSELAALKAQVMAEEEQEKSAFADILQTMQTEREQTEQIVAQTSQQAAAKLDASFEEFMSAGLPTEPTAAPPVAEASEPVAAEPISRPVIAADGAAKRSAAPQSAGVGFGDLAESATLPQAMAAQEAASAVANPFETFMQAAEERPAATPTATPAETAFAPEPSPEPQQPVATPGPAAEPSPAGRVMLSGSPQNRKQFAASPAMPQPELPMLTEPSLTEPSSRERSFAAAGSTLPTVAAPGLPAPQPERPTFSPAPAATGRPVASAQPPVSQMPTVSEPSLTAGPTDDPFGPAAKVEVVWRAAGEASRPTQTAMARGPQSFASQSFAAELPAPASFESGAEPAATPREPVIEPASPSRSFDWANPAPPAESRPQPVVPVRTLSLPSGFGPTTAAVSRPTLAQADTPQLDALPSLPNWSDRSPVESANASNPETYVYSDLVPAAPAETGDGDAVVEGDGVDVAATVPTSFEPRVEPSRSGSLFGFVLAGVLALLAFFSYRTRPLDA